MNVQIYNGKVTMNARDDRRAGQANEKSRVDSYSEQVKQSCAEAARWLS